MKILVYDYKKHTDRKIVIYGATGMGYAVSGRLERLGIPVFGCAGHTGACHALFGTVMSAEELAALNQKEELVILFTATGNARTEAAYLSELGITQLYSVRRLLDGAESGRTDTDRMDDPVWKQKDQHFFTEDTIASPDKLWLYSLDVMVTERCSLRCKDCSNLMQYYAHPQHTDLYQIKTSLDRLLEKAERIFELRILGGEPFMNSGFVQFIEWYKEEKKIDRIVIVSNATIFPDETVLEHLKHKKVRLRMSDYGSLSGRLEQWIGWCTKQQVTYEVLKLEQWHDCGHLERHDYSEEELQGVYAGCSCRNLPVVLGDYLYNCPYAANAANLGAMYRHEMEKDRLRPDEKVSPEEIRQFLYGRKYLEACRYCLGRNPKWAKIEPNIQTQSPLEYERLADQQDVEPPADRNQYTDSQLKLVSIIIPAYNMQDYIRRCVDSILESSYKNLEVIIIDDGSDDQTAAICKEIINDDHIRNGNSGRIRLIEQKHGGAVRARNAGIQAASGTYLTFADADDYMGRERLAQMAEAMEDCDLVCAGYTSVNADSFVPDEWMDQGQGTMELCDLPAPVGVYEGAGMDFFIRSSFLNYYNRDKRESNLWNRMFLAEKLKGMCERVDPDIWFGEDLVLTHLYMLECGKVRVIRNYGYYYCIRDNSCRYPFEGILANAERIYHCLHEELKKYPQAVRYENYLMEEFEELVYGMMGAGKKFQGTTGSIYYPYYGRLTGKRVILYGAGNVGKAYYRHMTDDDECFLTAWTDRDAQRLRETEHLPVEPRECLFTKSYDYVVIAVFDKPVYQDIRAWMTSAGVKEERILWNPTKYER